MSTALTELEFPTWCEDYHLEAAYLLSLGITKAEVAKRIDVTETSVYRWLRKPDFSQYVDQLTLVTGLANKAERVRKLKLRADQLWQIEQGKPSKKHDFLDYLRTLRDDVGPQQTGSVIAQTLVQIFGDVEVSQGGIDKLVGEVVDAEVIEVQQKVQGD